MPAAHVANNSRTANARTEQGKELHQLQESQKDQIRSLAPSQLASFWETLEKNEDITYSYDLYEGSDEADEEWDDTDDLEMDSEVSTADEEELPTEYEETGDGDEDDPNACNDFFLEVTIDEKGHAHCSAPDFSAYLSATPKTTFGNTCIGELSNRQTTLKKLAVWLENNRQNYLLFRNVEDLGEKAWEEFNTGKLPFYKEKAPGQAKALPDILEVDSSTFVKHIEHLGLHWEGVICSLEILFSQDAKTAWAKAAYKNMPEDNPHKEDDVEKISRITGVPTETIKS